MRKWKCVWWGMFVCIVMHPMVSASQTEGGAIASAGTLCIASNTTPPALISVRSAVPLTGTFYWEKTTDPAFSTGVSQLGANSQNLVDPSLLTQTTYYRRTVPTGASPAFYYSNVITVTVGAISSPNFTPLISAIPEVCTGANSFSVPYTTTANTYSILWSSAAISQGFTDVIDAAFPAGPSLSVSVPSGALSNVYQGTLIAADLLGCTVTNASAVQVYSLPSVNAISGVNNVCMGNAIALTNSTPGGVWSSSNTSKGTINVSGNFTGVAPGTATVSYTVTDAHSCVNSAALTETINALPTAIINPAGSLTFCAGGSVTLNSTAGANCLWSSGETTPTIVVTAAGVRTVAMTDVNGCTNTSAPVTTIVNPLPVVTITPSGTLTFCSGGSVSLSAPFGSVYSWSSGETSQSIIVNNSGTRRVTMTDGNGCSATSNPLSITVNALPAVSITPGGPLTVCSGSSVTLTSSPAVSYQWNSGETTQSIVATTTHYSRVTVTDANGCSNTSATAAVTVNAQPVLIITEPQTICAPATVDLTSPTITAGSEAGLTFARFVDAAATVPLVNPNAVSTGGTYYIKATSSITNCAAIKPVTFAINTAPVIIVHDPAVCVPATIDLTDASIVSGSTPGLLYTHWQDTAATIPVRTPFAVNVSSTYYIKGTNKITGCETIQPVKAAVNPLPNLVINDPLPVCIPAMMDLTAASVTAGSTAALSFSYWKDMAATDPVITPNAVSQAGTYYIKAIFPTTGCGYVQPVKANIVVKPFLPITTPTAVCEPATIDLTAPLVTTNSSPGQTFTYWSNAAATIAVPDPKKIAAAGVYYVKGMFASGCATIAPITATINPAPAGILQTPAVNYVCSGSTLALSATNAFGYQWYGDDQLLAGETNATFFATKTGRYTVQFFSKDGCIKNAPNVISLRLLTKPTTFRFNTGSLCITDPVQFLNATNIAESGNVKWIWDFGDGTSSNLYGPSHQYKNPGNYTVSLTDSNLSCPSFTEKITNDYAFEAATPGIKYETVDATTGRLFNLSARPFGTSYLWKPATGLNSPILRSPNGMLEKDMTYSVDIVSAAGCVTTDSVFVKITNDGAIYVAEAFTPNGDGINDKAYPILRGVRQLNYFKIFNRWGNVVFQTSDAAPQNGWDGKYLGKMQPSGTYAWTAEAIDGNGILFHQSGKILLIN